MANKIIAGTASGATTLPVAASIDGAADYLAIYTASEAATQAINRNTLLGLSSQPLGLTDTQSPTNKTLGNTNIVTIKDANFTLQDDGDTTKQAKFQLSGLTTGTTRTYTLPNASVTLASLTGTETLTNKTLISPTITSPTITNATISADAVTGFSSSTTGTIYGISVAGGALNMPGQLKASTSVAPPAGGLATAGILLSSTSNLGVFFGSGAPTFSAAQGSIYLRTDGSSSSTRLYVNSTGSTTWVNFTSAS